MIEEIAKVKIGEIIYPISVLEEITYSNLKSLRDVSGLTTGGFYHIIDYVTTTKQANTSSASFAFDILVQALDANTLNETAYAIKHNGDTHFTSCNLSAWELKYSLDNNESKYAWAVTGSTGRGVIYYMKDEFGNEAPYDFKNIKFNNKFTFGGTSDESLNGVSHDNIVSCLDGTNLPFITFGTNCYGNKIEGIDCHHISIDNSYVRYCTVKDGVQYINISGYTTTSSSYLQRVTILGDVKGTSAQTLNITGLTVGTEQPIFYNLNLVAHSTVNSDGTTQLVDENTGDNVYPMTKAEAVFFNNDTDENLVDTLKKEISRGFFIDYNHLVSVGSVILYTVSDIYDTIIIPIITESNTIVLNGKNAVRFNFFSAFDPVQANYLKSNTTGVIPANAKFCYITLKKNASKYYNDLIISYKMNYDSKNALYRCLKDSNHLVEISADGDFSGYNENADWDCFWVSIPESKNIKRIIVNKDNFTFSSYRFFSDLKTPSSSTYISSNLTGVIPSNAKLCCISLKHSNNPNLDNFCYSFDFEINFKQNIFSSIENSIVLKNYIDINNLYYGYIISSGNWSPFTNGIATNKLFFEDGKTYAMQGIRAYGATPSIYIGYFDENDEYIGRTSVIADSTGAFAEGFGKGLFTFNKNTFSTPTSYCRVILQQDNTHLMNSNFCQIELGNQYTEVVSYYDKIKIQGDGGSNISKKKVIKFLSIGNSYSQDALAYVPYIIQNMHLDIDIQIGILMMSSSSLSNHVDNFNNETSAYTFYLYQGNGSTWQNLGSKTIQWALDNYYWNEISLQQSSSDVFKEYNTYYQPYLNQLINLISNYIDHSVKFGWYAVQARPASTNSGANWSDSEITTHYQAICSNAQKVINETICEFLIPVNTAIQNARSISAIKALGDYASNPLNTSGLGYLTPNDGVHLQEGLPCQIAAYSFILSLLDLYGLKEYSILGETTRVTAEWASGKNIPGPHGNYIGSTDQNSIIAQQCAIMAMKNPYQLTDMNYIINPT